MDRDTRFRVVDKENSGYGATMNRGLDEARGEYIGILESDDFFEGDALEKFGFGRHRECIRCREGELLVLLVYARGTQ